MTVEVGSGRKKGDVRGTTSEAKKVTMEGVSGVLDPVQVDL